MNLLDLVIETFKVSNDLVVRGSLQTVSHFINLNKVTSQASIFQAREFESTQSDIIGKGFHTYNTFGKVSLYTLHHINEISFIRTPHCLTILQDRSYTTLK